MFVVYVFVIDMGEPQLIVAHQGQYLPSEVEAGRIVQDGAPAIAPRDVLPFGLQEDVRLYVAVSGQNTLAKLVQGAQSRAGGLGADYFSIGQVVHQPATSDGWEIVSAATQAYLRNPRVQPPAVSSPGRDTIGSEREPDG